MRRTTTAVMAGFIVGASLGASAVYWGLGRGRSSAAEWIEAAPALGLSGQPRKGPAISFSTDAMLADLPLPEVTAVSIRAKFLPGTEGGLALGYVAQISVKPLDTSKIPERYRSDHVFMADKRVTVPALKETVHAVHLDLELRDGDGFLLATVAGPSHPLESGRLSTFQDQVPCTLKPLEARRVKNIRYNISIESCSSCST